MIFIYFFFLNFFFGGQRKYRFFLSGFSCMLPFFCSLIGLPILILSTWSYVFHVFGWFSFLFLCLCYHTSLFLSIEVFVNCYYWIFGYILTLRLFSFPMFKDSMKMNFSVLFSNINVSVSSFYFPCRVCAFLFVTLPCFYLFDAFASIIQGGKDMFMDFEMFIQFLLFYELNFPHMYNIGFSRLHNIKFNVICIFIVFAYFVKCRFISNFI